MKQNIQVIRHTPRVHVVSKKEIERVLTQPLKNTEFVGHIRYVQLEAKPYLVDALGHTLGVIRFDTFINLNTESHTRAHKDGTYSVDYAAQLSNVSFIHQYDAQGNDLYRFNLSNPTATLWRY